MKKNSHFGDLLIYLNEKSPYMIKCYSRQSEYLTLSKSDYNKISILYNKIIIQILEQSYNFFLEVEKNKQIVIDLFDLGIKLFNIKRLILSIYSCLINKKFFEFFYGKRSSFDKSNSKKMKTLYDNNLFKTYISNDGIIKNKMNSFMKENRKDDKVVIISLKDFIINQDILDIFGFFKTDITEKEFDKIFIYNKLNSKQKHLMKQMEKESDSKETDMNSVSQNRNNIYETLQGKINTFRTKNIKKLYGHMKKSRYSLFKEQLLGIGDKIKKILI